MWMMESTVTPEITLRLRLSDVDALLIANYEARTEINTFTKIGSQDHKPLYWTLDLRLQAYAEAGSTPEAKILGSDIDIEDTPSLSFLRDCVNSIAGSGNAKNVRFIFAKSDGFKIRSDILERRLECCEFIKTVNSFTLPLQAIKKQAEPADFNAAWLLQILPLAIGGIELSINHPLSAQDRKDLNREMSKRLSFSWISSTSSPRRIAWVQGREDIESSRRAYEAAKALGISLVILESPGHWLEDNQGTYAHLREAFIPINIDVDEGFATRIVKAIQEYPHPIDGVVSISDARLPGVAKACEILGLPTSPHAAYEIAGNKAKTRLLEQGSQESFILPHVDALPQYLQDRKDEPLQYPMIVKPCIGWSSDCVAKVSNEDDLFKAVRKASHRHKDSPNPSTSVIVEPYIDGPEVDANFIILDGKILFFDINDDFPSRGDADGATCEDNFQETQNVFPTALPASEVAILRDKIHQSILRQGFTTGIFHCEARVQNSTMHYQTQLDGIVDLAAKEIPPSRNADVYLLEINARPPGYLETVAVLLTYGVDYYAVRLLLAIGSAEADRISALTQPFFDGPQFHLSAMIIPQTKAGVMKSVDAAAEFLQSFPELRDRVPDYKSTKKSGDVLEGPAASSLWWIAYFSVFSRSSRQDCLRLVRFIEQHFTYEVV